MALVTVHQHILSVPALGHMGNLPIFTNRRRTDGLSEADGGY
jgi:hypothetical protein